MTIEEQPNTDPTPPAGTVPLVSAVTNAASMAISGIAPGEIVTIMGQNIGPAMPNASAVQVLFDSVSATVLYGSATQINAVAPDSISGATNVSVVYNGFTIPAGCYVVSGATPGVFTDNGSGRGAGAILNQSNNGNSPATPALRRSVVQIFGTGAGAGALPTTVTIGGQVATVTYAGPAPNEVHGLLQVNAVVPSSVIPGSAVPVTISIGGISSQSNVTIAVQ